MYNLPEVNENLALCYRTQWSSSKTCRNKQLSLQCCKLRFVPLIVHSLSWGAQPLAGQAGGRGQRHCGQGQAEATQAVRCPGTTLPFPARLFGQEGINTAERRKESLQYVTCKRGSTLRAWSHLGRGKAIPLSPALCLPSCPWWKLTE